MRTSKIFYANVVRGLRLSTGDIPHITVVSHDVTLTQHTMPTRWRRLWYII